MPYFIPMILTPTILFALWYAFNQDVYGMWKSREEQRVLLQKQFYQNRLD